MYTYEISNVIYVNILKVASLERPENSCAATLPIQPDRAREDLQRRMGETPQIQVLVPLMR